MFKKQHCVCVVFANTFTLAFTVLDGKDSEEDRFRTNNRHIYIFDNKNPRNSVLKSLSSSPT
jgi:hypothetical protein